eukprot:m.77563 g.77563  ORF g.77563 m.77563 type:complete len:82 (+) comp50510_c0_seq5:65-310(+)
MFFALIDWLLRQPYRTVQVRLHVGCLSTELSRACPRGSGPPSNPSFPSRPLPVRHRDEVMPPKRYADNSSVPILCAIFGLK